MRLSVKRRTNGLIAFMDYNLGNDEHGERDQESSTRLDVVQERDLDDFRPACP